MMLVIIFEQIFLLYFDAGGRSLLIGDCLENCWLATSNSCMLHCWVIIYDYKISFGYHKKDLQMTDVDHYVLLHNHASC